MEQLPPKAREQIAQKMLKENKKRIATNDGGQGSGRPTGTDDPWGFCTEQWRYVVEDVKSKATKTRVYEMKKQMMLEKFKIRIREV